jgi:hypothetical protein
MNKVGKYEFASNQEALEAIRSLGVSTDEETNQEYPTHEHSVVDLGNIVLTQGEYDEEGNELIAPVLSENYHVDVMWKNLVADEETGEYSEPDNWKSKRALLEPGSEGIHGFFGVSYISQGFGQAVSE